MRGAVSIARRVQDPLAELVRSSPKPSAWACISDVDQGELARSLHGVVESVVNQVGVDVSTTSPALLTYVAKGSGRNWLKVSWLTVTRMDGSPAGRHSRRSAAWDKRHLSNARVFCACAAAHSRWIQVLFTQKATNGAAGTRTGGVEINSARRGEKAALDAVVQTETLQELAKAARCSYSDGYPRAVGAPGARSARRPARARYCAATYYPWMICCPAWN